MKDNRSEKVKRVCKENINAGCAHDCPLRDACKPRHGDTKPIFDARMNEATKNL